MNPKVKSHLRTYGMAFLSLLFFFIGSNVPHDISKAGVVYEEIYLTIFSIIACTCILICAVNIIRFQAIPRPKMQSITGLGAVIAGLVMLVPVLIAEISLIVIMIQSINEIR
jgi:hypothetical protein